MSENEVCSSWRCSHISVCCFTAALTWALVCLVSHPLSAPTDRHAVAAEQAVPACGAECEQQQPGPCGGCCAAVAAQGSHSEQQQAQAHPAPGQTEAHQHAGYVLAVAATAFAFFVMLMEELLPPHDTAVRCCAVHRTIADVTPAFSLQWRCTALTFSP